MSTAKVALLAAVCLVFAGACRPPSPRPTFSRSTQFDQKVYDRLAVYVESRARNRPSAGALRAVEDEFMKVAMSKGYTLVARSDLDQIMAEIGHQGSPLTEEEE